MSGTSTKSKVVAFRLPNEIMFTLQRRIDGRRSRWDSIGHYLREIVIYQVTRKHGGRKKR